MKRRTKKKTSTCRADRTSEWEGAKNATRSTKGRGTKSTKKTWTPPLILLGSSVKDIADETNDLRDDIDARLRRESWERIFSTLTEREVLVIRKIYWDEMNLSEIGKMFGVTRERVRQIHEKGMRKLRHPSRFKMFREFDIPIWENWYQKIPKPTRKGFKKDYVPPKPHWVKVEFNNGVPRLVADVFYIWQVQPITRKVYDAWVSQALEEHEALHRESSDWKSTPSI